ncbi:MAG: bifunctional 5,10-methylene-tetrahydrofolate dehydrogenase/5,10-methylene-tetrahydrofolate cyclohydrolase [Coriobacteriales bacterium]|jgi:methylenetetrahydrofolate dehydrogenase (NADP+)/methenyltetrahydrofolate cyclohydrolase|nr:bifunctional 5,10-methylene-tetrahydrofolate dehydrogenase/5,10-methylene-tetrahydrofolate cyclohydrolase [Coriobacteriales bacterium]
MAELLQGAPVVEALDKQTAADTEMLKAQGVEPTLAIVRVGDRGDDISYERGATKRAEKVGVAVRHITLTSNISQTELLALIQKLNGDASVHGVLLFRPLPQHIDEDVVCNALAPEKDVDGICDLSLAAVFADKTTGYAPCTAQACMELLDYYGIDLVGKNALVVGRSLVAGKPVSMMLLGKNATVTVAHSRTADLRSVVAAAEVVIACVGRARLLDASYLRAGQTVIDVGINMANDGSLVGDVDFEGVLDTIRAITPVPGGVGTVTTSVLVKHVVEAAQKSVSP